MARSELGDDLHAHLVLGGRGARVLDRQHRLHGGDRDGELRRGRARAWSASAAACPATSASAPSACGGCARPLDHLERQARRSAARRGSARRPAGTRRAAPAGRRRRWRRSSRSAGSSCRSAGAGASSAARSPASAARPASKQEIVLCSAPWYSNTRRRSLQAREQPQVAEEDRGAQDALDEPEQERRAELVLEQRGQPDRARRRTGRWRARGRRPRCRPTCRSRSALPPPRAARWRRCRAR